ncbi:hypothetical protein [Herbaspirillum sp. RV1423]|uniref:hypothetical protein n=1 Tax=Herbaspirillum sp. RV1423 TaxID=1443993 RepID=UPI0004B3D462|nr:hypothetical protein [Herbaspirillum sp. RV1423]
MDDATIFAREISYVSATIAEFERLLATELPLAERERIEQSLKNLYATREELRDGLEQLLSIRTRRSEKE